MTVEEAMSLSLERIADTLDDFMDMTLSLSKLQKTMQKDPDVSEALAPLLAVIDGIALRRALRQRALHG